MKHILIILCLFTIYLFGCKEVVRKEDKATDGIYCQIESNKVEYVEGEPIALTLKLHNPSTKKYYFRSGGLDGNLEKHFFADSIEFLNITDKSGNKLKPFPLSLGSYAGNTPLVVSISPSEIYSEKVIINNATAEKQSYFFNFPIGIYNITFRYANEIESAPKNAIGYKDIILWVGSFKSDSITIKIIPK